MNRLTHSYPFTTPDQNGQAKSTRLAQTGMTLVELLVAMVIGMLIIVATYATLTVARQGFGAVSATSQLRDNARFAIAIIQQLGTQAGYKDDYNATYMQASSTANSFNLGGTTAPDLFVEGQNSATPISSGTVINNSDVLTLRSLAGRLDADITATLADQSIINCMGSAPTSTTKIVESTLFVANSKGQPSLMCRVKNDNGTFPNPEPILEGVESFQVLYGVNTATDVNAFSTASASFQFKRADELTTDAQWRQVRSLRIGMVLRADAGSAQDRSENITLYPLGEAFKENGSGSQFTDPKDGRVRQVVTFTVQLRNNLNPPNTSVSGLTDS